MTDTSLEKVKSLKLQILKKERILDEFFKVFVSRLNGVYREDKHYSFFFCCNDNQEFMYFGYACFYENTKDMHCFDSCKSLKNFIDCAESLKTRLLKIFYGRDLSWEEMRMMLAIAGE